MAGPTKTTPPSIGTYCQSSPFTARVFHEKCQRQGCECSCHAKTEQVCEACEGNVLPGKSCYACGLKVPAGTGVRIAALDALMAKREKWPQLVDPHATIGALYEPAMKMTEPTEAAEYFAGLVARQQALFGKSEEEAAQNERINLGYFSGYYDSATMKRVQEVFSAAHPVFGRSL